MRNAHPTADDLDAAYGEHARRNTAACYAEAAVNAALRAQGWTPGTPFIPVTPKARTIRAALSAVGVGGYIDRVTSGRNSTRVGINCHLTDAEADRIRETIVQVLSAIWPGTVDGSPRVQTFFRWSVWVSRLHLTVTPECDHTGTTITWTGIDHDADAARHRHGQVCRCCRRIRRKHTTRLHRPVDRGRHAPDPLIFPGAADHPGGHHPEPFNHPPGIERPGLRQGDPSMSSTTTTDTAARPDPHATRKRIARIVLRLTYSITLVYLTILATYPRLDPGQLLTSNGRVVTINDAGCFTLNVEQSMPVKAMRDRREQRGQEDTETFCAPDTTTDVHVTAP